MGAKKLTYYNKTNHYYPFGMLLPNRHENAGEYRYEFNGMEKDDEVKGEGNSYDFGARLYNPRIGRWMKRDPLEGKYPDMSPYNYVLNCPIKIVDFNGEDIIIKGRVNGKKVKVKYTPGAIPPEGADEFITEAYQVMNEKINNCEGEVFTSIANDESVKVTMVKRNDAPSQYIGFKNKNKKKGTLYWNTREGIVVTQFADPNDVNSNSSERIANLGDQTTYFSPADILEHEMTHAFHYLIKLVGSINKGKAASNDGLTDKEEENTINEADDNNGQFRKSHGALPYHAKGVNDKDERKPEDLFTVGTYRNNYVVDVTDKKNRR